MILKEYSENYEKGLYPQPSSIRWERPDEDYYRMWAKFIYGLYCSGMASPISYCDTRTLRSYYSASQNIEKYKTIIDTKDPKKVDRGGQSMAGSNSIVNISWENFGIYQKYVDIAASRISDASRVDPFIRAVDSMLNFQRKVMTAKAKLMSDERLADVAMAAGSDVPKLSKDDIDTAAKVGGMILPIEALMQGAVNAALETQGFEEIQNMLRLDAINLGVMSVSVSCDAAGIKVSYVDPAGLICPANIYEDHRGDQFVARLRQVSISSLRDTSGLSEDQIVECAKAANQTVSNGIFGQNYRANWRAKNGYHEYDGLKCWILEFHFVAAEAENYVVGSTQSRGRIFDKVERGSKLSKRDIEAGKSMETITTQKVFSGNWVIGTDVMFGCKEETPIRFNGEIVLPIQVHEIKGSSITHRCMSIIDDMQLAVLKVRQLVASLPSGPAMLIDVSLLEETIQFGSNSYTLKDMLSVFGATGKLIVRSRPEYGGGGNGSSRPPVTPISTDIQGAFNMQFEIIVRKIEEIRQITGVNEITDGTGSANRVLNGVAQAYQDSSNTALSQLTSAVISAKKGVFFRTTLAIQNMARMNGGYSIMAWPVKSSMAYTIEIPEEASKYTFSVSVKALPSAQDIEFTLGVLAQNVQQGLVGADVQFAVMDLLRDGNITAAQLYLSKSISKEKDRQMQERMALIQAQANANTQAAVEAEKERQNTTAIAATGAINKEIVKAEANN